MRHLQFGISLLIAQPHFPRSYKFLSRRCETRNPELILHVTTASAYRQSSQGSISHLAGRDELFFHEKCVVGLQGLPEGVFADFAAPRLAVGRVSCAPLLPAGHRS